MHVMKRIYKTVIDHHLQHYAQMMFVSGPRQVGKTTIARQYQKTHPHFLYLNWDNLVDRKQIMEGVPDFFTNILSAEKPLLVLDEIHKFKNWKNYLKGFFDTHKDKLKILVTGSAKLNIFRRGGDSLMGRYFLYRVNPLSVAELLRTDFPVEPISRPKRIEQDLLNALLMFGGFPEPFIKQDKLFYQRWQNLRNDQMLQEDIRALSQVIDVDQLALFVLHLQHQTGQLVNYHSLGNKIQVSDQTVRRWIILLSSCFYCFIIKPWSQNVTNALIKMPKVYLTDWSIIQDKGARLENFIACHLLKAVQLWNDVGLGQYDLNFIRDKAQNEVDFLITKSGKPWLLVEVKASYKSGLSKSLFVFKEKLKVPHALQVAADLPYVERDCFSLTEPTIVPMATFLSQLA